MKEKILRSATAILAVVCAVTAIALDLQIYFTYDGQGQMYTAEIIATKLSVLAVPVVIFIFCVIVAAVQKKSGAAAAPHPAGKELYEKGIYARTAQKENAKQAGILRAVLFVVAVVLIVFGIFNGGMRDVLVKAINICTECIGLG